MKLSKLLIISMIALLSCQKKEAPTAAQGSQFPYPDTVNVTYVKAPLNVPLIVGRAKNIFQDAYAHSRPKQKFTFHELTTGPEQIEALAAKSIDITSVLGATSAIISATQGSDIRIISIFSRAPKTFAMETKNDAIKSIADLKGKKIAGPRGTILHQLLLAALEKEGLSINDVQFIPMGLPEALAAMNAEHVDVALLAGAAMVQGVHAGAKVLTTGDGLVEGITVVATRKELLDKYPRMIDTYFDAHKHSVQFIVDNWDESLSLTAKELGLSVEDVADIINLYDFDMTIKPTDIRDLAKTQDFLFKTGLISKKIDVESIVIHRDGENYHPWNEACLIEGHNH